MTFQINLLGVAKTTKNILTRVASWKEKSLGVVEKSAGWEEFHEKVIKFRIWLRAANMKLFTRIKGFGSELWGRAGPKRNLDKYEAKALNNNATYNQGNCPLNLHSEVCILQIHIQTVSGN